MQGAPVLRLVAWTHLDCWRWYRSCFRLWAVRNVAALSDSDASQLGSPVESRALDRSLLRGVAWTAGVKWASQALSWVSWLIVARLLTPEDYGLVGMAAIYLGLITLLSEFGLGTAVLAVRELNVEQLNQLNGLAVLLGLASLLASCIVAIPLGRFFHAPQLPLVVVAMSTTFLITAFKTVPFALLQRDLRFKALALIDLSQALIVAISMIGFAVAGFGFWTLVCGGVLGALFSTGAVLRLRHSPLAWPRLKSLKPATMLSSNVLVSRLCWYVSANADFLVAGRILGKAALGLYGVGWTLASVPVDRVAALVGQVTPAFFSAVQTDRAALRRYLLRITEGIALITFPLGLGLALVARDFVLVVLGSKWSATIAPLQLLAAYAAFRSITPLLAQVLHTIRDTRFEMWNMVAAAVVMPTSFYFCGQRWGTVGLAMAWLLVDPLIAFRLYRRVFSKIELTARAYFAALWPALSGTALMAAGVLAVGAFSASVGTAGLRLAAQIGAGVISYGLACLVLHRERLKAFYELAVAARRGSRGAGDDPPGTEDCTSRLTVATPVPQSSPPTPVSHDARRLLVITWYFPPDGAVGALRWAGIAKYLARLGWKVSVVTAASPARDDAADGVHVESCPHLWTSYRLLGLLKRRLRKSLVSGSGVARPSGSPGLMRRLQLEVRGLLTFPDSTRGWVLRAALRSRSLIRRFQPHVVVSSGPPHFAHLTAGLATIGSSARWFIDLRDPWAGALMKGRASDSRARTWLAHALVPRLERLVFRAAQGVIANTVQHANALAAKYPDLVIACIPNAVDPEGLPPPAPNPYPGLGIAYTGSLYLGRDLAPVVRAFRMFLGRHPDAVAAGSKLRVAGHAEASHALAFDEAVAAAGLEQQVEVLGLLPRAEALNVVSRSRLVVVLAQDQPLQIPTKLYESVAMRIPTLVVAGADSAAAGEGARLGAVVRDPADVEGIAGVLEQLWQDGAGRRSPGSVPITYEAIAPLVDELLRGSGVERR